jgi:asparagine synthase (glutamine-hydrolysing)
MTLLAGVYARRIGDPVPESLCDATERALSRHPNEQIDRFRDHRCFLVKADVGAFGEKAFRIDADAVSLMCGEPLLDHGDRTRRSRTLDLDELHDAFSRENLELLSKARGVFSAAHYQRESGTLILVTDKLGIRPMYYWLGERFVIFASAIRILEQISEIPKAMDVRAVTEENSLGYALADRTAFASVALLKSAEILRVAGDESTRRQYWRWDDVKTSARPMNELVQEAHAQFVDAVAIRAGGDSTTVAFLSGGLDSRAIVTALRDQGLRVHSFNFSVNGLQDQVFGAAFAERIGTIHTERPMQPTESVSAKVLAETWIVSPERVAQPAERPGLVWSGDGGSVTLGHVYLNRAMVEAARAGDAEAAIQLSSNGWGSEVPRRLLTSELLGSLSGKSPRRGLVEELDALHCDDAGRGLHLVLMHNDQRRHLAAHFEGIDLSRLEYQLPFFDSAFVESVLRVPLDFCLGHKLYMEWLRCFPEVVLSVPWQAYPGHEPCPLPIPSGIRYQWGEEVARIARDAHRRKLSQQAAQLLRAPDFPKPLLHRQYLRLAIWLYRLRLRDVGYVIRAAHRYYEYWSKCRGRYVLPA